MPENKTYEFNLPTKVISGLGSVNKILEVSRSYGDNILLVTGKNSATQSGLLDRISAIFASSSEVRITYFAQVEPEPDCDTVDKAVMLAKEKGCDLVVGMGGGSALDVAKAVAGIANKEGEVEEFMTGKELSFPGIPCVTIPTTAGTGAEVTPNAVLINPQRKVKESFRHYFLYPKTAIIDAELILSLPPKITAYSGMDALCQGIESYVSQGANILTDAIALQAVRLISNNIREAFKSGANVSARENMLHGALLSGIALANARMGAVHGIAHPLGLKYHIAHGLVCGVLLPHVMEFNLYYVSAKYAKIAEIMGSLGKNHGMEEAAKLAVDKIKQLLVEISFPWRLRELGVKSEDFDEIAKNSLCSGSIKTNPRTLNQEDVVNILKKAY